MTTPADPAFMELATPYALHAMPQAESDEIDRLLADAPELIARAFADEVRAVREVAARLSASTAVEPPEHVRTRLLAAIGKETTAPLPAVVTAEPTRRNWRSTILSAAAALIVGL